ncbi:MAG: Gfo/Idh/MocA family oxidoreductase [Akkermansiaceae bacterium]|nr:Gfo/Idh/MocA family oxidoreductase [Akkermansiaceae bacterium]
MSHRHLTIPRRRFLATTLAAGVAPQLLLRAQSGSANDEITMGLIGCGGMGNGNMRNFLGIQGVRVVAVCDPDNRAAASAKDTVDNHYGNKDCKSFARHTDLLALPSLDTVIIATPDHCHAMVGIDAAEAGKDIYGEKPFTWGLAEGRKLADAVSRNKRVWQTGSWQRSGGEFRRFKALIENHTLGKLTRFECGTPSGMNIQHKMSKEEVEKQTGHPPEHLDWNTWCGPVKDCAYQPLLHPWDWRWHENFGGGQLLDWVGHHVDIALWTLGLEKTGPVKVEGSGEKGDHYFFNSYVKYAYQNTFADGRVIEVRSDFGGTKFTGENGWIHVDRGRLDASDRELLRNLPESFDTKPPSHWQNFIHCVRSRETPVSHAEGAHRAASIGQLALVAMDTKQPVRWNPETESVIDNAEQAAHPRLGSRLAS